MDSSQAVVEKDFYYDPEKHLAPPIRIQWIKLSGNVLMERWVYAQCCGQTEKVRSSVDGRIISSVSPCRAHSISSSTPKTTGKHHPGTLVLKRCTRNEIIKHTPPLAEWSCCGAVIPAWDAAWDAPWCKQIPFEYVDTGCEDGPWDEEAGEKQDSKALESELVLAIQGLGSKRLQSNLALAAKPVNRRSRSSSGISSMGGRSRSASGISSFGGRSRSGSGISSYGGRSRSASGIAPGDQMIVLEKGKLVDPQNVKFTQETVERSFSDGSLLLDVMAQIFHGQLKINDIPEVRVAVRVDQDNQGMFYCLDNRLLLMFKLLRLDKVRVTLIEWMSEFDDKLEQNIPFDPESRVQLDKQGLRLFRKELVKRIVEWNEEEPEKCIPVYIPSKYAGYVIGASGKTIRLLEGKYGVKMYLEELKKLRKKHPVPNLTDMVAITIQKRDGKENSNPNAARKQILKMVMKFQQSDDQKEKEKDPLVCQEVKFEKKRFYFDSGKNEHGSYLKISEVSKYRNMITIPQQGLKMFKEVLGDICTKLD